MEVMSRVAPVTCVMSVIFLLSTFTSLPLWDCRPDDIMTRYRVMFSLMAVGALAFSWLSRRYLATRNPTPGRGELIQLLCVVYFVSLGAWITIADFAQLGRYFVMLSTLFVVFGLFFVPVIHTLLCELIVFVVTMLSLMNIGYFAPIQVVTLACYLLIILAVSASNYSARLRAGVTTLEIMRASRHDDLTGMLNRRAFEEDANLFIGQDVFVVLADIDEFKYYNDLFGHAFGDKMLIEFAQSLQTTFGVGRVYRFGGDEFIAVAYGDDEDSVRSLIEAWRDEFHARTVDGRSITAACSAGCVQGHVDKAQDMLDLLRVADMLLFRTKQQGHSMATFATYSDGLLHEAITHHSVDGIPQESIDALTGLMNKSYFLAHAADVSSVLLEQGHTVAFVYLNVNNLKGFNARHGFAEGDELLRFVAQTLQDVFPGRLIARFGDDRFVLMSEDEGLGEAITRACSTVREHWKGQARVLHAGIYRYTSSEVGVRHACDLARVACESLSGNYDALYCYYTDELEYQIERRARVLERLGNALEKGYIQPYYQPIIRSASNLACEFEILARWIDPHQGILSPADFIPALEEMHLIHRLDLRIVEEVCKNYVSLQEAGLRLCPVSINFSRLDFEACDVVEEVVGLLDRYGLPHDLICVEITESAFADSDARIRDAIKGFHEQGMQVWMDDFGSGYSALDVLREYDFDLVKFDMSFVRGMDSSNRKDPQTIMLTHLVGMVKELGLQTLIEGVETEEQLAFLRGIAFEKVQGYVFSRPVAFDEVRDGLQSGRFAVEESEKHDYYVRVGKVNLLQPIEANAEFDPLGMADGLPAAVLEYDGSGLRYLEYNAAYVERLKRLGMSSLMSADDILGYIHSGGSIDTHKTLDALRNADDWVVLGEGAGGFACGFVRCVARVPGTSTFAMLFYALPYSNL